MVRKTFLLGLLVLVALAAGAPALVGLYLERNFDDVVARFDRPTLTRVVSSRFERGWFSSTAQLRIEWGGALCSSSPCAGVTLNTTVHHGPVPFGAPVDAESGFKPSLGVAVTRIDPASLWPRVVFDPALSPLRVVTRVGFEGSARSRLAIDGQSVDISRERRLAHVDAAPVIARATLPLGEGPVAAGIESSQFSILGENGGQLSWRNLEARFGQPQDGVENNGGAAPGGGILRVESLRAADGLGLSALLQSLVWQWQPLPAGEGRVSARLDGRIARAVINNNEYGPLLLAAEIGDIDIEAWRGLVDQLGLLRDVETGALDPEARATLYGETLPALLAGAPHIDIQRLLLSTPSGDVRLRLRIEAPETMRSARLLADVISQLDVDFDARLPAGLARDLALQVMLANGRSPYVIEDKKIDAALAELVDERLIEAVDDGAAYRLRLTIDAGRLTLNGRNQIGWQAMVDQFEAARERL